MKDLYESEQVSPDAHTHTHIFLLLLSFSVSPFLFFYFSLEKRETRWKKGDQEKCHLLNFSRRCMHLELAVTASRHMQAHAHLRWHEPIASTSKSVFCCWARQREIKTSLLAQKTKPFLGYLYKSMYSLFSSFLLSVYVTTCLSVCLTAPFKYTYQLAFC